MNRKERRRLMQGKGMQIDNKDKADYLFRQIRIKQGDYSLATALLSRLPVPLMTTIVNKGFMSESFTDALTLKVIRAKRKLKK